MESSSSFKPFPDFENWIGIHPYNSIDVFKDMAQVAYRGSFRNFTPRSDQSWGAFYFECEDGVWVQHNVKRMTEEGTGNAFYLHEAFWGRPGFSKEIDGAWYLRPWCSLLLNWDGLGLAAFKNHDATGPAWLLEAVARALFFWSGDMENALSKIKAQISRHERLEWNKARREFAPSTRHLSTLLQIHLARSS